MSKYDYFKELNYRLRGLPEKERQNILTVYEELFQKAMENGKNEEDVAASLGYPRVPNWEAAKEAAAEPAPSPSDSVRKAKAEEPELPPRRPEPSPVTPPSYEQPERHAPQAHAQTQANPHAYGHAFAYQQYQQPPYPPYPTRPESGIKAIIVSIALGFFNLLFVIAPWFGVLGALVALFTSGIALLIAPLIGVIGSFLGNAGSDMRLIFFAMLACFGVGIILTTISSWLFKWYFKLTWKYIRFNAKLIKGA
ncbi:DUF1700 domain-containing protein [Paenibacillus aestuarii]|uniref:DUF1700 domain-containing protein n=1 Tax=Paenibacillus aestuarii TaxID=516965 RepID=A0ABW0K651_9BACL|nr:DUF1700 domain-containing protein [Paenibacillus aestuarii]